MWTLFSSHFSWKPSPNQHPPALLWVPFLQPCLPWKETSLVYCARDGHIARKVGFCGFPIPPYFWTKRKASTQINFKLQTLLWLSPDIFAYSSGAKAKKQEGPTESQQERNTREDAWRKCSLESNQPLGWRSYCRQFSNICHALGFNNSIISTLVTCIRFIWSGDWMHTSTTLSAMWLASKGLIEQNDCSCQLSPLEE